MSKNISQHRQEKQAVTRIDQLTVTESRSRGLQEQGTQAIRLGVVEGYFAVDLPFGITENARFVEFEAPEIDNILIGSVVHSRFWTVFNPAGGGTTDFTTVDDSNTLGDGELITTWMPYSLATDDPDYDTPFSLEEVPNIRLPDNRVRVGCKVNLTLGNWTLDTVMVVVMYQLRFTIGWR